MAQNLNNLFIKDMTCSYKMYNMLSFVYILSKMLFF